MDKAKRSRIPGQRYLGLEKSKPSYAENESSVPTVASDGSIPRAMIISCCDSRVHVTSLWAQDQVMNFLYHRNIAKLWCHLISPTGQQHGTLPR